MNDANMVFGGCGIIFAFLFVPGFFVWSVIRIILGITQIYQAPVTTNDLLGVFVCGVIFWALFGGDDS